MFPDLRIIASGPTRLHATLDILLTNYAEHGTDVSVNHALEAEDGRKSDHRILMVNNILPRPRAFTWEVHEYLKTSREGDSKLIGLLNNRDWGSVQVLAPNVHDMALEFHRVLDELMLQCYEWKRVRRKNTDKPWISDGLRASIKKRAAIFRDSGRCKRWKKLDKAIKKTLSFRKSAYNKRQKERLEACGRT